VLGHDVPLAAAAGGGPREAPGQYSRHYAPRTPLLLVDRLTPQHAGLCFGAAANAQQVQMPADPEAYAAALYRVLHALDGLALPALQVERPPAEQAWEAVWDRLRKASSPG